MKLSVNRSQPLVCEGIITPLPHNLAHFSSFLFQHDDAGGLSGGQGFRAV